MSKKLTLMVVTAHPDDESLGAGGILTKYSREGIKTYVVCATRGERGRYGDLDKQPSLEEVGIMRTAELLAAAQKLGVTSVSFLDYLDGDVCFADSKEATAKIVAEIRKVQPDVILTFGPEGGYGHPDHIAVSQFTAAAIICAADSEYFPPANIIIPPNSHRVSKFYFMSWTSKQWEAYQSAFKDLKTVIDGIERRATPTPDWVITTSIDTTAHWETVWEAVKCHKTQLAVYSKLRALPEQQHLAIWGQQDYYRVFSTVNGGKEIETDLFEGLR